MMVALLAEALLDHEVAEEVVVLKAARAQTQAREHADRGEFEIARKLLSEAVEELRTTAAGSAQTEELLATTEMLGENALSMSRSTYDPSVRKQMHYQSRTTSELGVRTGVDGRRVVLKGLGSEVLRPSEHERVGPSVGPTRSVTYRLTSTSASDEASSGRPAGTREVGELVGFCRSPGERAGAVAPAREGWLSSQSPRGSHAVRASWTTSSLPCRTWCSRRRGKATTPRGGCGASRGQALLELSYPPHID